MFFDCLQEDRRKDLAGGTEKGGGQGLDSDSWLCFLNQL